mmetsp:Transcript_12095/g.33490  ORF Transcript_12095/g.33490 Transcript_12095/m.33490 type:complete len:115 (+) Transcript_12095:2137-2481(+)
MCLPVVNPKEVPQDSIKKRTDGTVSPRQWQSSCDLLDGASFVASTKTPLPFTAKESRFAVIRVSQTHTPERNNDSVQLKIRGCSIVLAASFLLSACFLSSTTLHQEYQRLIYLR